MSAKMNALLLGAVGIGRCRAFSPGGLARAPPPPSLTSKLGFSFTPGGLLFPYHLGVAKSLELEGFLASDSPLAGSSAG